MQPYRGTARPKTRGCRSAEGVERSGGGLLSAWKLNQAERYPSLIAADGPQRNDGAPFAVGDQPFCWIPLITPDHPGA